MASQTLVLDTEPFHQRLSLLLHGEAMESCANKPQYRIEAGGFAPGCACFDFVLSESEQAEMQGDNRLFPLLFVGLRNRLTRNLVALTWESRREWLATGNEPWRLRPMPYRLLLDAWRQRWPELYLDDSIISRLMRHTTVETGGAVMLLRTLFPSRGQWLMHGLRRVLCTQNSPLKDIDLAHCLSDLTGESIAVATIRQLRQQAGIPSYQDRCGFHYGSLFGDRPGVPLDRDLLTSIPAAPAVYELTHPDKAICYPQGRSPVIYIGASHNLKKRLYSYLGDRAHTPALRDAIAQGVLLRHARVDDPRHSEAMLLSSFAGFFGAMPHLNHIMPKHGGCGH